MLFRSARWVGFVRHSLAYLSHRRAPLRRCRCEKRAGIRQLERSRARATNHRLRRRTRLENAMTKNDPNSGAAGDKPEASKPASQEPQKEASAAEVPKPEQPPLTPEEQMARFEQDLKETDWGHQPC